MAKGLSVLVSADCDGKRGEGIISGTPKPGTHVELVPTTAPVSGRFTYRAVTRANGAKGQVTVLLEDSLQGKTRDDAYVTGTRCFLYWPRAGDEMNLLLREQVGTGTGGETNIGDLLAIEKTTGELMAGGALASTPYQLMERVTQDVLGTDTHHWVTYLGNQA